MDRDKVKEYRELARWSIYHRKYDEENAERLLKVFECLENPGWWDRSLIWHYCGKYLKINGKEPRLPPESGT